MTITVNGEQRDVPNGLTVAALIEHIGLSGERVAVEHNRGILARPQWKETIVQPNDSFEIVHFVGGG